MDTNEFGFKLDMEQAKLKTIQEITFMFMSHAKFVTISEMSKIVCLFYLQLSVQYTNLAIISFMLS